MTDTTQEPAPTQCFCGGELTDGNCSASAVPHAECPIARAIVDQIVRDTPGWSHTDWD